MNNSIHEAFWLAADQQESTLHPLERELRFTEGAIANYHEQLLQAEEQGSPKRVEILQGSNQLVQNIDI